MAILDNRALERKFLEYGTVLTANTFTYIVKSPTTCSVKPATTTTKVIL